MGWIQTGATIIFKTYTLEEALHGLAEIGFANVEIGAVAGFVEHLHPDDLGPATLDSTQRLLDRYGLRCVSMSGHAPMHTEEGIRRLRNVVHFAKELGAGTVNTFSGDAETPDELRALLDNTRRICDEAQGLDIHLCMETDSNLVPTAEVGVRFLEQVGHPWLQLNYDPGNVVYFAGGVPEEDVKLALPHLGHVHLKDKRGGKDVFDFPPLGEGDLDIPSILRDISASGFAGPVSMEIEFDGTWPSWEECLLAGKRSKAYWDGLRL